LKGFKTKLSPKDLKKAEDELNEDPKTRNDKIKEVITRCKASPSIPASCYPRIDMKDQMLKIRDGRTVMSLFCHVTSLSHVFKFWSFYRDKVSLSLICHDFFVTRMSLSLVCHDQFVTVRASLLKIQFFGYLKRLDDGFVLRYLRVAKFDVKNAVNRLERFFQLQRDWPELYGNWKFDDRMERLLEAGSTELMPDPDEDGVRYLVFRLSAWDPAVDSVHEVYRACIFLWEYILLE